MSYHNNTSSYFVNSTYGDQNSDEHFNGAGTSRSSHQMDVRYSTLEPTAQEFHPSYQNNFNSNNGAIKKKTQSNKYQDNTRSKNSRYGSGRTYNSRNSYYNKSDYVANEERTSERSKVLEDTARFLGSSSNQSNRENQENKGEVVPSVNYCSSDYNKSHKENRDYIRGTSNSYQKYNKNKFDEGKVNQSNSENQENKDKVVPSVSYFSSDYNRSYKENKNLRSTSNSYQKYNKNKFEGEASQKAETYENQRHFGSPNRTFKGNGSGRFGYGNNYRNNYYDGHNEESHTYYDKDDAYSERSSNFKYRNNGSFYENNRNFHKNSEVKYQEKTWRNKDKNQKQSLLEANKNFDTAGQKERLVEMLNRRLLECLVCCEKIKNSDKIWSCMQCYHILHLTCVAAWAKSSKVENGWRCPACQNVCTKVPKRYKCYCGKTEDPKHDPSLVPHACGDMCLRKGRNCEHKCAILCHPGPCPDCNIMVAKPCGCGATQPVVKCSTDLEIICDAVCNKVLECGVHNCTVKCHSGPCSKCEEVIIQECFCAQTGRKVPCTAEYSGCTKYSCGNACDKLLSCGNHKCPTICHDGPCGVCERDVSLIKSCFCGKTVLKEPRTSCLAPIPTCEKICDKVLLCGQPSSPHRCQERCHEGPCPACPLTTVVRCRCGHMDKELPCQKLTTKADDARCEKKCTKKRLCGKHKCNQRCCIEIEHFCPLPCNHQLSCGRHRCERTCHSGRCPPCMETSFEELYCECGASVLYPPVPCGTKPPTCNKPCSRQRPCGHEPNHSCHAGPCPPCFVLSKRWCHGHHEQRAAIPCHQENFGCGFPCGKKMPCGRHKCVKPCHEGPCPLPCKQPCTVPRSLCGHPCSRPCHDPPCLETSCKQMVPVTCACGLQKSTKPCIELIDEFRNIEMAQLKDKIGDLSKDQTVDISDIAKQKKPVILKILECNEECHVLERNRRLAIGLQIRNPDLSQKLTPRYSDFMRNWAKKDAHFCQKVHDKLTELVQLSKQSKQKSRSYSFDSMNRDKRHFIHEYCEHFGVESTAYDLEPNRNIVATAVRDKSWLPSMSLLEVLQRENGQRKVPGPVLAKGPTGKSETVSLKLTSRIQRANTSPSEPVDYFDHL